MARDSIRDYYGQRAAEYETVYGKPERQHDLRILKTFLESAFSGKEVLEVACGTGYWTQHFARSASAVLAADFSPEPLELARQKDFGAGRVRFTEADAYRLDTVPAGHTVGFHGFWWSHIPLRRIPQFLSVFHAKLSAGAKVVMIDNLYVEGNSTAISRRDSEGNTYQLRKLTDGSEYEVLKNFPSETDLYKHLSGFATDIRITRLHYLMAP